MNKILVANRGEIAMRIMRTCKDMKIKTVAVYSEADRTSPHVRFADEAVCIGPPASKDSYLRGDKIIEVAKKLGVEGIHPGYGFLSENAEFADQVINSGIRFIGPSAHAMNLMGDKLSAKNTVKEFNVPLVPGVNHSVEDIEEAHKIALEIGFPVLVKASAGGGGKGMRVVEREEDLKEQLERAVSEATSAFGNGAVFIERYVAKPRHIEIQIMADNHGNVVYLFERECSIQRRHQKVIEEAPSVVLTPELRKEMGEAAVSVSKSCNYSGAGTVEFLYEEGKFYFLEMNTRLQVEHPVTEMITGIDLVREQINIARGEKLSFTQDDLKIHGHALEVRVYAEDPANNFLPDTGSLVTYKTPKGTGVRVDDGFVEGMDIPIYYDPMLAKLVTYGSNRKEAIQRMVRAIDEYEITGVKTTLGFCRYAIQHEAFVSGDFDTQFVKKYFTAENLNRKTIEQEELGALLAVQLLQKKPTSNAHSVIDQNASSSWKKNRSIK